MATYQSNDYFPEGGNYKAGDIVYSPAGAPVAAWIHTGRDFVPYHKAENEAIGGVTSETDLVTGVIENLYGETRIPVLEADLITRPAGFDWQPPVQIYRIGNRVVTNFDPSQWMVPAVASLWVSLSRGSDTTGDGSYATPYKSIWKAISVMSAATTIYVEAGIYDRNYSWKGQAPQYPVNVIGVGGEVVSSMRWEGGAWTLTTNGTYQATRSLTAVVADENDVDEDGLVIRFTKVTSQAICEATPRSWYSDGPNLWVHTFDGRQPDAKVLVMIDSANAYTNTAVNVFVRGIILEGGLSGFTTGSTNPTAATRCVFDRVTYRYSKQTGASNVGIALVINHRCAAYGNGYDGFGYTIGVNTISPKALEIDCVSFANGDPDDDNDNDNASTSHNNCRVVRIGTIGKRTRGPIFADVDTAKSWNINCGSRDSLAAHRPTSQSAGFQALGTATQWMDGCLHRGSGAATYKETGAAQYQRNCSLPGSAAVAY